MSNPWETKNPWGKGSKEWNRWMEPGEGELSNFETQTPNNTSGSRPLDGRKKSDS